VCSKKISHKDQTRLRKRLLKRFEDENREFVRDLNEDERAIMVQTLENTVKNAQTIHLDEKQLS
jgi:hypothetical protein